MTVGPVVHTETSTGASPYSAQEQRMDRWSETTIFSILVLFSVLPYSNTLLNGFVYDDTTQILDNPYILSFRHLGKIFSTTVWSYVGNGGYTNYYRPMMTFGYLLCFQLFGAAPYGYHLANILLHAGVVWVLYLLTRRMFGNRPLAFLAAGLFALHPMHTESVDWVAAVTDLEVTFFFLLTFWFFLKVPRAGGKLSEWVVLGMAGSFLMTIFSKEQALMLPALATAYEHFYREDRDETTWSRKLSRYSVLWLLALAYLQFRVRMFGAFAPITGHADISRYAAFLSGFALLGQYMGKLFWPVHLCAFYVFRESSSFLDPQVIEGIVALTACGALFAFLWKRQRIASFGFVWFFATLAPVLNVRWLASDNVFAERYIYLPSVGFCWLIAYGWMKLWERVFDRSKVMRWGLAGGLSVVAVLCGLRIVTRNRVWRNEIVFYTTTLAASPDAVPIYNNLGSVYWNRGDVESAEREWRLAFEFVPDSPTLLNNLGLVYTRRKEYPKAVEYFKRSIREKPVFPDPHLNLGVAYQEMGLNAEAELQYRAAMGLAPLNVHIRNRLGGLYLNEGRIREAEEQFATSSAIAPNVVAYDALGEIFLRRGVPALAEQAFQHSISLNPADHRARLNLAALYVASGRKAQAVEQYQAILRSDPNNPDARTALERLLRAPAPNQNVSEP